MAPPPPSRSGPSRSLRRVWALDVAIVAAAGFFASGVADLGPLPAPLALPWWVFIPLVFVAELSVVHLKFREDAHSFSMSEIPLVAGLFLTDPLGLIAAQFLGNLAALGLMRRQPPVKLVFNLGQFTLQTAVAILVFRAIVAEADPVGVWGVAGTLAAVTVSLLVATALITTAIRLSGGRVEQTEVAEILVLTSLAAWMNAGLGLVAVTVIWAQPQAMWMALVPPVVLFLAYRAYATQRLERQRLQALYEATRILHRSPQIEAAMLAAVTEAQAMFGAASAEIVLHPDGPDQPGFRTAAGPDGEREVMKPIPPDRGDTPWSATVRSGQSRLIVDRPGSRGRRGADGMVVALGVRGRVIGALVVHDPLGDVSSYGVHDLRLLETLAAQVGVSLENGRLEDSLVQLTRLKEELRHQALHDALTGLANRSLLRDRLAECVVRVGGEGRRAAVMFLDLDDFKTVNDAFGHGVGDQLLVAVARRLEAASREHDTVARLGGDEFAVLFDRLASEDDIHTVVERIQAEFARPFQIGGHNLVVTASIGIAFVRPDVLPDEVIRNADQAMYGAKHHRKGSYQIFEDGGHRALVRRAALRSGLAAAIAEDELQVEYQPIVALDGGDLFGIEALARWRHVDIGVVSPDEFIPVAEETGLIVPLGRWMLQRACRHAARWQERFPGAFEAVTVNLSPLQLTETDLLADVDQALAESGLEPGRLVLEITESVLMQASGRVLEDLRRMGVRVAIDDFGTGYSSLGYLDMLPIDILKVDKSFVARAEGPQESPLLKMVEQIGEALDLVTIAEGVETRRQVERLLALGFRFGQGFHLVRPLTPDAVESYFEERFGRLPVAVADQAGR